MKSYWDKIGDIEELLKDADRIVLGIGAGMSAAGGINYGDSRLFKDWFPEYYSRGFQTIAEVQSTFWWLNDDNKKLYWGYWAKHIQRIRYDSKALTPYLLLKELLTDKTYFICSTNADGQLEKAKFNETIIFAPQGDYKYFQCSNHCTDDVYENKQMIEDMLNHMDNELEVNENYIPLCPNCSHYLIPNLRCDDKFVDKPHLKYYEDYSNFIAGCENKKTVFLELGVGYNTPGIIRFPFEKLTMINNSAHLIRINQLDASVPDDLVNRSISLQEDLQKVLSDISYMKKELRCC